MIDVSHDSVAEMLSELERFAEKDFPPLLPKVQSTRMAIMRAYIAAGKPMGKGVDNANLWFNTLYRDWQRISSDQFTQEMIAAQDTAESQLLQMGDLERVDSRVRESPKGLARTVVFMVSMYVEAADRDGRGLEEMDIRSIEYVLAKVLAELQGRRQENPAA